MPTVVDVNIDDTISTFDFVPNIFGSWTNAALDGLPPNAYVNGGDQYIGGATGSINWVTDAYTELYGLQIEVTSGGLIAYNTTLPGVSYTITGNEVFLAYAQATSSIPDQIELEFYDGTSWAHRVYLGTDYFNFGSSVNIGNVPTSLNQWFSFTFTAADLGLAVGQIITGIGWGAWKNNLTTNIIFSNISTFANGIVVSNVSIVDSISGNNIYLGTQVSPYIVLVNLYTVLSPISISINAVL